MDQILVVDDEADIRDLLHRHLSKLGYSVILAENGLEALECFNQRKPPVTILDLSMPEMDGITFLESLDSDLLMSHGIIVMTGTDDDSKIEACFRLGVQSFLRKPVNLYELEGNIKRSLELHKAVSQIRQLNQRLLMRQQDFPNFLWECDRNLRFTWVDDHFIDVLGYNGDDVIGTPITDYLAETEVGEFLYKFTDSEKNLKSSLKGLTLDFMKIDGEIRPLQIFADASLDNEGTATGMIGICRDMSIFQQLSSESADDDDGMTIRINDTFQLYDCDESVEKYLAGMTPVEETRPDFRQFLEDSSVEHMLGFAFDQKEDIPFPVEIRMTGENGREHRFSVQLCYCEEGPCMEGQLVPLNAEDQLGLISDRMKSQQKTLEDAVILDDKMKQSILKDARNLAAESLTLVKTVESYAYPAEGQFNLDEYAQFLFNRNLQVFFENLRLLGNKIHGLKGSCGFLNPRAKELCHRVEDITRPLSEQHLLLTKDMAILLKQVIFRIQDILDLLQDNPDAEIDVSEWTDNISQTLNHGLAYLAGQEEAYTRFVTERCTDKGEIRERRVEEYLSVSLNGYEKLAEQTRELYYSLSDSLSDERAIQASSLFNQFLQSHQEIKKVPLDLSRYERLIPNLAKEYEKEADLLIEDHQVKADREFWNAVHEILNHVLKNAIIHGIETPQERTAQQKDAIGKVSIKLAEDALHILLSISDDGRGINKDRIAEKAIANGVITRDQLEKMSENEILNLLFVQGVSTAESLDDNAGRGVGMNAVEEAMHQFRGSCRIETETARGCTYHFSFAKSNVSLPCIVVAVDDVHIAIPEDNVESFIDYRSDESIMVKQQLSYRYNDGAVPLIDHERVFELDDSARNGTQNQLIVLKSRLGNCGLVIDDILHHAVMPIMPLPKIYRQTPIYLGITFFGDTPVQVVDVDKLI